MTERSKHTLTATVQSVLDLALVGLEQRRDNPRASKPGMTQELLTGRARLV